MLKFSSTYSVVVTIIIKCLLTKFGLAKHECVWLLFMTHGPHCAQSKYLASHLVNKYIIYFFKFFRVLMMFLVGKVSMVFALWTHPLESFM